SGYSGEASIDTIGFAIPINSVNRIVTSIIENGYILKPYIGVTVSSMSEETANITGIKSGAVVHEVTEDAPAARAGIKAHDVITKVDDTVISSSEDLVKVISDTEPGSVLRFYVYRQGKEMEIDVTVESKTESATKHEDEAAAAAEESANQAPQDGQRGQQAPGQNPYYYEYGDGNGNGNYWGGNSMEDFFRYFFGY
ncbi:MAG: PDZ domain-containing protein, partial [Oscillospiraceae bacterium]|nr:PDZ domain-containing protein [Oscillospiraceae bacterium]